MAIDRAVPADGAERSRLLHRNRSPRQSMMACCSSWRAWIQSPQSGRAGFRRERAESRQPRPTRRHGRAGVRQAARSLGFRSINFDLIYGLPLQTLAYLRGRWTGSSPCGRTAWPSMDMPTCRRYSRRSGRFASRSCRTPRRGSAPATRRRQAERGRIRIHRHGSFCAARRLARAGAPQRHSAPQLSGVHDSRQP